MYHNIDAASVFDDAKTVTNFKDYMELGDLKAQPNKKVKTKDLRAADKDDQAIKDEFYEMQ